MAYHDVRLSEEVERGARGGPRFKTTIIGVGGRGEQRNQEWQYSRAQWDISYGVGNKTTYTEVITFFMARRGRLHTFPFKDWTDYEATTVLLGTGDNSETDFQLIKLYTDAAATYVRKITRPVEATVQVYVDSVLQTLTTDYTIEAGGVISFVTPPGVGLEVTATFEFDIPVRFDVDQLEVTVSWEEAAAIPDLTIIEVLE